MRRLPIAEQTVLITGASTGIGRDCALTLDRLGFIVYAGVRSDESAQSLEKEASPRLVPVSMDVTDAQSVDRARAALSPILSLTGLNALINNAGVVLGGPLECISTEAFSHQLDVNVLGVHRVTQSVLPWLRQATTPWNPSKIINLSSVSGLVSMPFLGPYAASKFALEALSDAWRLELNPQGIQVVLVEPGAVKTPIWEKSEAVASDQYQSAPAAERALYETRMSKFYALVHKASEGGLPVELVTQEVVSIINNPYPKARYPLGKTTRLAMLLSCLPDGWMDRLKAFQLDRTLLQP